MLTKRMPSRRRVLLSIIAVLCLLWVTREIINPISYDPVDPISGYPYAIGFKSAEVFRAYANATDRFLEEESVALESGDRVFLEAERQAVEDSLKQLHPNGTVVLSSSDRIHRRFHALNFNPFKKVIRVRVASPSDRFETEQNMLVATDALRTSPR